MKQYDFNLAFKFYEWIENGERREELQWLSSKYRNVILELNFR